MPSTEKDLTLLSSYIDGQLTEKERASLETRLKADASLRADLDSLRATVALLKQAERVRVPRSFTLDPKTYGKPARPSLWEQLGWSLTPLAGAASTLAVVMILGGGFVLATSSTAQMGGAAGSAADVAMVAPEEAPMAAGASVAQTEAFGAETEQMTQMMAEATEAPAPDMAAGESAPAAGAGGEVQTFAPTAAAALPAAPPSPSDNMRAADPASADSSTTGGQAPEAGFAQATPKMVGEDDSAASDGSANSLPPTAVFYPDEPASWPPALIGGTLIAAGAITLAIVVITRRK